jgi:hypothetical protein
VGIARRALTRSISAQLLVLAVALWLSVVPMASDVAKAQSSDPTEIVTFHDEAGKRAQTAKDDAGADQYGDWAHRRWTRDMDNEEKYVGPVVTDSKVWVAKNVETAQRLYKQQADQNATMPERDIDANGPFPWAVKGGPQPKDFADEGTGASACRHNACEEPGKVFTHRRVVIRVGRYVATVYLYGRDETATPELATWFARKMSERMHPPEPEGEWRAESRAWRGGLHSPLTRSRARSSAAGSRAGASPSSTRRPARFPSSLAPALPGRGSGATAGSPGARGPGRRPP